jgi:Ankyrin repeats (3 copies)
LFISSYSTTFFSSYAWDYQSFPAICIPVSFVGCLDLSLIQRDYSSHGYPDPDQAPVLPQLESHAEINIFEPAFSAAQPNESQSPCSTPNTLVAPSLTFGATTPIDPPTETGTPQAESHGAFQLGIFERGNMAKPSAVSPLADSMQTITSQSKGGQKRPAPSDFDMASLSRVPYSRFNRDAGHRRAWARTTSGSRLDMIANGASGQGAEARSPASSIKATKAKANTIADVEEKNSLPKGFLSYIKRLSVLSADSARASSDSVRSRWSRISSKRDSDIPGPQDLSLVTVGRRVTDLFNQWRHDGKDAMDFARRLELLIQDGADTNARDETDADNRPLHVAIAAGNISICQVLLDKGADVDAQNQYGQTPLAMAVVLGDFGACQLLLEHGANVSIKTNEGVSILGFGKRAKQQAHINPAQYLAIEACRNLIREYNPRRRPRKASNTSNYTASPPAPHPTPQLLSWVRWEVVMGC